MRIRLVAAVVVAACMACGLAAEGVTRATVALLAGPAAGPSLRIRSGPHGVRISNLTDETWSACVVTLDGGYVAPGVRLAPRGRVLVPYAVFAARGQALTDRDGFTRAFRATSIECSDEPAHRQRTELGQ